MRKYGTVRHLHEFQQYNTLLAGHEKVTPKAIIRASRERACVTGRLAARTDGRDYQKVDGYLNQRSTGGRHQVGLMMVRLSGDRPKYTVSRNHISRIRKMAGSGADARTGKMNDSKMNKSYTDTQLALWDAM